MLPLYSDITRYIVTVSLAGSRGINEKGRAAGRRYQLLCYCASAMAQQGEPTREIEPGPGIQPDLAEASPDVEHGDDLPVGVQLALRLEALIRSGVLAT